MFLLENRSFAYPDDCELDDCELCGRNSKADDEVCVGALKRPTGPCDVVIIELDCVRLYGCCC